MVTLAAGASGCSTEIALEKKITAVMLEMLIRAGLLEPGLEHSRDELAEALARQIDLLAALEE